MDEVRQVVSACSHRPECIALSELAHSLDEPLYVVGGAVRDLLMGHPPADWDFAGPSAIDVARRFARRNGTRVVMLHQDQPTARVPVPTDEGTHRMFDFCDLRAGTLEDDLRQRDFTINAIAYNLRDPGLVDPLGGVEDVRSEIIRTPDRSNLEDDPIRCLRACRFFSQLGFEIDGTTREWIADLAHLLENAAGERIGTELHALMYPPRVARTFELMDEDGVLARVLPELEEGRGMPQPSYHHLDVRAHILETLAQMEKLIEDPVDALPASFDRLEEYLVGDDVPPLLIMAALMHDIGKPRCFTHEEGRIRFMGHDKESAQMAGEILGRFAWPSELRGPVVAFCENHMRPTTLASPGQDGEIEDEQSEEFVTLRAIRRMFREVEPHELGFTLLALADSRACQGPAVSHDFQVEVELILDDMVQRYYEYKQRQQYEPLLTGQDLIDEGYTPGPMFSEILEAVEDAHIADEIHTKPQALQIAREIAEDYRPEDKEG